MPLPLLPHLEAWLCRRNLTGARLLVAVSGGADSVALLRGLAHLRSRLKLHLHVAHLDHALREESAADAQWVADLAHRLELPCTVERLSGAQPLHSESPGLEESARRLRYEFLERTAREQHCPTIAVAHTADDQAETVLHHILRGTGLSGLRGMRDRRPLTADLWLVRPLLELRRADLREALAVDQQDFREDATNRDESYTRNRLRHKLLPQLEADYNPQIVSALLRLATQAEEAEDLIGTWARELLSQATVSQTPTECVLRVDVLRQQPRHAVREMFVRLWGQQNWPRQKMTFFHWDRLAGLVAEEGSATFPSAIQARCGQGLFVVQLNTRMSPGKRSAC